MRAEALRLWAERLHGRAIDLQVHQTLETTHPLYRFGVGLYNTIQRRAPRLHHLYFNYLEVAGMHRHANRILGRDKFTALVAKFAPHRVVSVHAHTNHGFFNLARRALPANPPRCITYCGELFGGYGFSRHWANPAADGFIGATPEVCAAARAVGTPDENVFHGGFLLRPSLYLTEAEAVSQARSLATELGLNWNAFTVVLSTGQAGANNHLPILRRLAATGEKLQVITLCSRNEATLHAVRRFAASQSTLTIHALGHTDRMTALLRLASAFVARPGTGATSEAILSSTPLIHNGIGGIMPQELITVQYCRLHNCALTARSAREVATHILKLKNDPSFAQQLRLNQLKAKPSGDPEKIVKWILRDRSGSPARLKSSG
jgi:processive 1,2-diacylglycerol beta-glucosyltransferase